MRHDIKDLSCPELEDWLAQHGQAAYRARQILKWVYQFQRDDFADMTNLAKPLRELLNTHFESRRTHLENVAVSSDGSRKYLLRLGDQNHIESVLIPEKDHQTLCISSQVGCALNCRFCVTGKGGFVRNLTCAEILSQVRDLLQATNDTKPLTNLVFMGMGEPLLNLENVLKALEILTDGTYGLGFSGRRITLSTAGIVPAMQELGKHANINLAVSLNATEDPLRSHLMPINQRHGLSDLLQACRHFPLPPRRRITFEYILMAGINDSPQDALRLARLLKPLRAKVNLIPLNEAPSIPYRCPEPAVTQEFQRILQNHNLTVMLRHSKGSDIGAACGQLGNS